jgi:hypothetical protein
MTSQILYKYLDAQGAATMLYNGDLQFTNATRLNDPFDCHPALIDFSKISPEQAKPWGKEDTILLESNPYERNRNEAWICSLSKINNSLPMWTFYAKDHTGACIGLDMERVNANLHSGRGYIGMHDFSDCYEVQYRDIIEKPDCFKRNNQDFYYYQMLTKAKEWEYEQEVRIFVHNPSTLFLLSPQQYKQRSKRVFPYQELRAYTHIDNDCFYAIYLGVNISARHKKRIIEIAKERNPNIKIYQMRVNPDALRLDPVEISRE